MGERGTPLVGLFALALALVGCAEAGDAAASDPAPEAPADEPSTDEIAEPAASDDEEAIGDASVEEPEPEPEPKVDPAEVDANELGEVPVLMYHRLLDDPVGDYDITPEQFRAELEHLYELDYRPVRMVDVARGEIDVPAGTSPVVLTFDDATSEQFGLTDDGEVDPDTAIGILLDVAAEHDGFDPVASLYVITSSLFGGAGQDAELLTKLDELGMETGNHTRTLSDTSLGQLSAEQVQAEYAGAVEDTREHLPDAEVATTSLPLGVMPADPELAVEGEHDGTSYHHEAVLRVGAGPAPSPFSTEFDPAGVPRIRSSPAWDGGEPDYGSAFWLELLEQQDGRRYISDGDPDTIAFPEELADELDPAFEDRAEPY